VNGLCPQTIESHGNPRDVEDRIDRPYLMEVNLVPVHSVYPSLGIGQHLEDVNRPRQGAGGQLARSQDGEHLWQASPRRVFGDIDLDASPSKAPADLLAHAPLVALDGQGTQHAPELIR
jgi:hypothetical protein